MTKLPRMESLVDKSIERVRTFARSPGWSKSRLAREAKMGKNGLVDLFEDNFNPTAETLRKIELLIFRRRGTKKRSRKK